MTLILRAATALTVDRENRTLHAVDIAIEGNAIAAIGAGGSPGRPGDTIVDCSDALVTPGLINVHTHAATALYRGLADDRPAECWSRSYAVPGQERFGPDDLARSARAACAEFLLNGVTCIADRLSGMDRIAPVIRDCGIRAVVGETLSDDKAPVDWRVVDGLFRDFGADPATSRVFAGLAPHATDSCSDALLAACAARAREVGCSVFVHVAQSAAEIEAIGRRGHAGALACLEKARLVGPRVVAAHCLYLDDAEIERWADTGTAVAHCPASNLKIEARTLAIHRLIGRVPIGLGTDWTVTNNAMDLLWEARLAALVGKMLAGDPTVLPVESMIRMLTIDGARVLGLDRLVGSIEIGKRADLVVFDLGRLEANPRHDLASNLLYAMGTRAVRDVLVDGEFLVRDGKLTRQDERRLARDHGRPRAKSR